MSATRKYVLITGATQGIGFELAKIFAEENYNLIIVARKQDELEKAVTELRQYEVNVLTVAKDLFHKEAPFELFEEVKNKGIPVEILVNNAAQGEYGKFTETSLEKEMDIIHLNIVSMMVLTKLFLKDMVEKGSGKILNVSSIAAKIPGPYQAVYHGTKAFIHSFTEAVRNEVKDTGVTLTSLLPGPTDTDFFRKANMESSKIVQEGELADPADVAKDGYKALMAGKDKIISGFKIKMEVAAGNVLPDNKSANRMRKQQKPVKDKKNK